MRVIKVNANQKRTKPDKRAFILFVLLFSYLVNFTACFSVRFKINSHIHR